MACYVTCVDGVLRYMGSGYIGFMACYGYKAYASS